MSEVQNKLRQLNFRVSDSEYEAIQAKAKEANLSVSNFLRKSALGAKIIHINNGNEIVKEMRSFHNDMLTYHNNMSRKLEDLKKATEDNSKLLREHPVSNTLEFMDTYKLQRYRISTLINLIAYQNEFKANEIEAFVDNIFHCI